MTPHTEAERAAYERELIDNHHYVPSDFSFKDGFYGGDDDYIQFGWDLWQAARCAPAAPVPQGLFEAIEHGDEKHRAWLKAALTAFFAGKPVPREVAAAPQPPAHTTSEHSTPMCGAAPKVDPIAWYVTGCSTMLDEHDAKAEAKRCGGCAQAVPLYTEHQVRELLAAHGIQEPST